MIAGRTDRVSSVKAMRPDLQGALVRLCHEGDLRGAVYPQGG